MTRPILVSGKGFVNPDFSTSPVQAVRTSLLYVRTGTVFGRNPFGISRLGRIRRQKAAGVRYKAMSLLRLRRTRGEGEHFRF